MNVLWRITKLAFLERWRMVAAWLSLILATLLFLAVPRLIGHSIDSALGAGVGSRATTGELALLGLLVIGVIAVRGVFN